MDSSSQSSPHSLNPLQGKNLYSEQGSRLQGNKRRHSNPQPAHADQQGVNMHKVNPNKGKDIRTGCQYYDLEFQFPLSIIDRSNRKSLVMGRPEQHCPSSNPASVRCFILQRKNAFLSGPRGILTKVKYLLRKSVKFKFKKPGEYFSSTCALHIQYGGKTFIHIK